MPSGCQLVELQASPSQCVRARFLTHGHNNLDSTALHVPIALRLAAVQAKHYKAIPVDTVVSVTGAGDSFVAAAVCTRYSCLHPHYSHRNRMVASRLQLVCSLFCTKFTAMR